MPASCAFHRLRKLRNLDGIHEATDRGDFLEAIFFNPQLFLDDAVHRGVSRIRLGVPAGMHMCGHADVGNCSKVARID
jgi:hypothetical protein